MAQLCNLPKARVAQRIRPSIFLIRTQISFEINAHSPIQIFWLVSFDTNSLPTMFIPGLFFVQVDFLAYLFIHTIAIAIPPDSVFLKLPGLHFPVAARHGWNIHAWSCTLAAVHMYVDCHSRNILLCHCAPAAGPPYPRAVKWWPQLKTFVAHPNMHNEREACWERKNCSPGLIVAWAQKQEMELSRHCGHTSCPFPSCPPSMQRQDHPCITRISLKFSCAKCKLTASLLSNPNSEWKDPTVQTNSRKRYVHMCM